MSPFIGTIFALYEKYPLGFFLWAEFAVLPLLVPMAVGAINRVIRQRWFMFSLSVCSGIFGYPFLFLSLIIVPWAVFQIYVAPAVFEAYPVWLSILSFPLAISNWVLRYWPLLLPLLWPFWVLAFTVLRARAWSVVHTGG